MKKSMRDFFKAAYEAAAKAGLSPHTARLAVAQAALETGYGRSVKGNNYFGVKAGKSWNGQKQDFKTWEMVNGKRVNMVDTFRKYDDPVDSFRDWHSLLQKNWPGALTAPTFREAIAGLNAAKKGGYATDEDYESKLTSADRYGQRAAQEFRTIDAYQQYAGTYKAEQQKQKTLAGYSQFAQSRAPTPSALMARSFLPGGIIGKAAVSLSPVGSAQASGRISPRAPNRNASYLESIQSRTAPKSAPAKTSTGITFSRAEPVSKPQGMYNRAGGAVNDMRQMPSGPISAPAPSMRDRPMPSGPISAPVSAMRDRAMPNGPISTPQRGQTMYTGMVNPNGSISTGTVNQPSAMAMTAKAVGGIAPAASAYAQMAMARQATPPAPTSLPPDRQMPSGPLSAFTPAQSAARLGLLAKPGLAPAPAVAPAQQQIAGPVSPTIQAPAQAPVAKPSAFKQTLGKVFSKENVTKAGMTAVGTAVGGPIGGLLAGIFGPSLMGQKNPSQVGGLLSGLFGGGQSMQSTYMGSGINAVTNAMGSDRRGDTARYNSQGGGFVTNLGNGSYQRTSDKHGWKETTLSSGHTGISYGDKSKSGKKA